MVSFLQKLQENFLFFRCSFLRGFVFDIRILYDSFHICFNFMYLSFELLILYTKSLEIILVDERHHIQKKWNIEYSIEHGYNFSFCSEWYEITEPYRCCCDDSEIECIKITLSYWMPLLEVVECNCSCCPWEEEYETDESELAWVVWEERHIWWDYMVQVYEKRYEKQRKKSSCIP